MPDDKPVLTREERRANAKADFDARAKKVGNFVKGVLALFVLALLGKCATFVSRPETADERKRSEASLMELIGPRILINSHPSDQSVAIWRSSDAFDRAFSLMAGGARSSSPQITGLIACIVPNGTQVAKLHSHMSGDDVAVTGGRQQGCEGFVLKEHVKLPSEVKK